jgi:O-antigen/teichoic acid export membrane protein
MPAVRATVASARRYLASGLALPGDRESLGARAFRAAVWSYGSFAGVRLLALASTGVLARLLSPRDFGLVALALIFTAALDSIRDFGVNDALIVAGDDDVHEQANTAFAFTLLLGVGLALVVAALSPLAAEFFDQPRLLALLAVLGVNLPLRALGLTHNALAQRRLDFRSRTVAELADVVVRSGVGITLALAGQGPWSLVVGYLAGTIAWIAVLWIAVRWRPALPRPGAHLSPLLRFGGALTVVGVIGQMMAYIDNAFVGKVLGPAALGVYSLGYRLPELVVANLSWVAGLVLFPAFATVDRSALRRPVITAFRYALLAGLPFAVALIVLADPLVLALFGPRWRDAAPVVQLLGIAYLGSPISQVTGSAYKAIKRVDVLIKLAALQLPLLVGLLAIFVDDGIVAVAGCQAGVRVLFISVGVYVAIRVLGLSPRELWNATWPAVAAGAGMAAVLVPLERAITSPWPAVVAGCTLGGAVYLGLIRLLAPEPLRSLWGLARGSDRVAAERGG